MENQHITLLTLEHTFSLMKNKYILLLIFSFAFAFRIIYINQVPPHLNWDEVSHGYNALSILKTGKDEWGEPYPTIFRAYGDYKLPVYIYTTVPFVALFGVNALSVRLTSILAGSLLAVFTFLLADLLFKNEKVAILAGILVAIEPWSLFLSRVAVEANLATFLLASGTYFLIRGITEKRVLTVLGLLLFSLSAWTYNSARIFAPLLVMSIFFFYRKEIFEYWKKEKAALLLGIVLFLVFMVPVASQFISGEGAARYAKVQILDKGAISEILASRQESHLPAIAARLVHNKYTYFVSKVISNYISIFSINFLYKTGGSNYQFNVPNDGLLFAINFVPLVFGVIYLIKSKFKNKKIILAWVVLAPIASSITRENPHTLRNLVMLPMPMILTSLGVYFILRNYKKYAVIIAIFYFTFLGLEFADYYNNYLTNYRTDYSWSWQYGYKQAATKVAENYNKYDKFIITKKYGEPHEFFLFYGAELNAPWNWQPEKFRKDPNLIRFFQSDWYWVDRFDKFYFMNDWDIPKDGTDKWELESGKVVKVDEGSVYLITSPGNYPHNWRKIDEIDFLNGDPAFDIVVKI